MYNFKVNFLSQYLLNLYEMTFMDLGSNSDIGVLPVE